MDLSTVTATQWSQCLLHGNHDVLLNSDIYTKEAVRALVIKL